MKQKAFTLIELLVVMVIVGILSTVSTALYSGAGEKAQEAKLIAERSDSCKESLGNCLAMGNPDNCQTFDACMSDSSALFTVTSSSPIFASYAGEYYDSEQGIGWTVWTNGTTAAATGLAGEDWDDGYLSYFETLEEAIAGENYLFGSDNVGSSNIVDFSDFVTVVGSQQ